MKQFIKFIAYLQVLGIILVVLGHSFHEYPDGAGGKTLLLYRMLHSFRMPLFMFVSGFLMVYTTRIRSASGCPGIKTFVKTKLKRLLVPFFVLTLVTFVPRAAMSGIADDSIDMNMESLLRSFVYADSLVIPLFWFLQASFILLIFSHTVITIGEKAHINNAPIYFLLVLLFVLIPFLPIDYGSFFSINEVIKLGLYFALGCLYSRFASVIDRVIPWTSTWILSGAVLVWAIMFFITENTPWIKLCSIIGIFMCICVAKLMEAHNIKILDHLVGSNYMIFLLSWYCNVGAQQVLSHLIILPWWCYTILSLISGIYIPWLGYRYLQNHPDSRWVRVTAVLLGQSFKLINNNRSDILSK